MSYQAALTHFQTTDPTLTSLAAQITPLPEITAALPSNYFAELCDAITSQQLSTKAAATIWNRFKSLFPESTPTAEHVIKLTVEEMRAIGCSRAKAAYIHDLANRTLAGELPFADFADMSDDDIKLHLTQVKGIGPWTAEMFLIFTMGRPDVFSPGDLGLKNAVTRWYTTPPETTLWSPYRSYASRILWKSLEIPK